MWRRRRSPTTGRGEREKARDEQLRIDASHWEGIQKQRIDELFRRVNYLEEEVKSIKGVA